MKKIKIIQRAKFSNKVKIMKIYLEQSCYISQKSYHIMILNKETLITKVKCYLLIYKKVRMSLQA